MVTKKENGLLGVGVKLKCYRKKKNLTQANTAEKIGISRQNISDIERGVFVGAISTLQKYLDFAGLELTTQPKPSRFPQFEELQDLFGENEE